ncbi:MAG: DUF4258 domain-containing protein [Proteobacteria bacterium]|nr:DUF4258 domain-containing protein [Pseudomonadota bacterium]
MTRKKDFLKIIKQSAAKKILFLPHAVRQMSKPDRMISTKDIRLVLEHAEIIEDYPEDVRGHSCMIFSFIDKRPIHVVCSPKEEYLAIITAYIPNDQEWNNNYKKRKES